MVYYVYYGVYHGLPRERFPSLQGSQPQKPSLTIAHRGALGHIQPHVPLLPAGGEELGAGGVGNVTRVGPGLGLRLGWSELNPS